MRISSVLGFSSYFWFVTSVSANPYLVIDSFTHSESVPIIDIVEDKWETPIKDGDNAFSYNWAEIGATYKGFGIGYLSRYDYEIEYSTDTAELYYLVNNKKDLPIDKQYDLFLSAKHLYSEGVRLSYRFQFNKQLELTIGGSYLKGLLLTEGKISGTATVLAENDYDFTADVNYYYSEDVMFDRKVESPDGVGYSIDTQVKWNVTRDLTMRLGVVDLIGRMYWTDAPNTTAKASSATKEYDEDGYVKYNPVLSGYETNQDYTQTLNPRAKFQVNYSVHSNAAIVGRVYKFEPSTFYQIGGEYIINKNNQLQIFYMFETNAISLGYTGKYIEYELTRDSLDIDKSYILAVRLYAHVEFF